MVEARTRRIHEVTFRGAPFWMRVPTFSEEVWAECRAAKYVTDDHGADLEIDEDLWRVDIKPMFLLSKACVAQDGGEIYTQRVMGDRFTSDELVELLHLLNACREAENPAAQVETDDEVADMASELASLDSIQAAYHRCAGMSHEAMVRLAWGASKLADLNTDQTLAA
jgi:hypothetical protein